MIVTGPAARADLDRLHLLQRPDLLEHRLDVERAEHGGEYAEFHRFLYPLVLSVSKDEPLARGSTGSPRAVSCVTTRSPLSTRRRGGGSRAPRRRCTRHDIRLRTWRTPAAAISPEAHRPSDRR